nr:putative molybdenum carrier protein [Smithella sp.]
GVSAITLGQNRESLSINRRHEHAHVHVRQYEMLGPIFIPVSEKLISWLTENQIKVLNVAGPRLRKDPTIYDAVLRLLKVTLSAA